MQKTGLLCGEKTGLEGKNKSNTLNGEHQHFVLVLLPVMGGYKVFFFNFELETDEAFRKLKISKEECSAYIPTMMNGEMKRHAGIDMNLTFHFSESRSC